MRCVDVGARAKSGKGLWVGPEALRRNREAGFTLVELLIVVSILVLLASMVAPRVIGYLGSSRVKATKIQIESLATSLKLYRLDVGRYPSTQEGLDALVQRPINAPNWNGPYVDTVPTDPWGAAFIYRSPGRRGPFEIWSLGADGKEGGDGESQDIANQ